MLVPSRVPNLKIILQTNVCFLLGGDVNFFFANQHVLLWIYCTDMYRLFLKLFLLIFMIGGYLLP